VPTYEYRCKDCSQELEVVQSFTDDALTICDACGGNLRKVFGSVGIAFKGSGFYKNDSRGKTATSVNGNGNGDKAKADSGTSSTSGNGSESSAGKEPASPKKDAPKKDAKPSTSSAASSS
jgi:putative FmdB family regulatory protein